MAEPETTVAADLAALHQALAEREAIIEELRAENGWRPIATVPEDVNRILGTHTVAPGAIIYLHRVSEPGGFTWADRDGVIWCPSHWQPAPEEVQNG